MLCEVVCACLKNIQMHVIIALLVLFRNEISGFGFKCTAVV